MPRRVTLTDRQKDALLRLPTSQTDLLKHYTLSDEDFGHIRLRRRAHNRFGFALQLCVLRIAATIAAGTVAPSQILRKLASYPRQNELATALREVGRVERTLFMIDWILDAELQRRAQIGLNKGEAHHALKRAISFHRRGEIRDRSAEGQHYRIAGMNLLAAIIIFWNTMKLGEVVANQKRDGKLLSPDLLAHVSPLGWEHINLTGEYRWPKP